MATIKEDYVSFEIAKLLKENLTDYNPMNDFKNYMKGE